VGCEAVYVPLFIILSKFESESIILSKFGSESIILSKFGSEFGIWVRICDIIIGSRNQEFRFFEFDVLNAFFFKNTV
jgi:hypothetical protein